MNKFNSDEKRMQQYEAIIDCLNLKIGARYRANTKTTQAHIDARFKEGYTVKDFITVIQKKCNEWYGTEYEKYLCPNTLFGKKFEEFLNSKRKDDL